MIHGFLLGAYGPRTQTLYSSHCLKLIPKLTMLIGIIRASDERHFSRGCVFEGVVSCRQIELSHTKDQGSLR